MRGSLVEAARAKRELIRLFIERIRRGERPATNVRLYDLPPRGGGGRGIPHAAEDGGSRVEDFEAYTLYIARGWAASYEAAGGGYRVSFEAEYSDVGIVLPQAYSEERVRLYRETLEALAALEVLPRIGGGLLLWDGSLRPLVAKHRPGASEAGMAEAARILRDRLRLDLEEALGELEKLWAQGEAPASPGLIASRLEVEALGDRDYVWVALLEWAEKLLAVKRLLESAWRAGVTPLFITKTSRSTSLFGGILPDVYYLKRLRRFDPFRTEHRILRGLEEFRGVEKGSLRGPLLPVEAGLDEFYRERLGLAELYVRLDAGAPILKVEVAFDAGQADPGRLEGLVERSVEALQGLPRARGYPLGLSVAHRRARLAGGDVERILAVLGLELERSGRWML
ncbi:MAG: DNA double-strand break repair nuclease NurA [Desulfurococcales archaeon]|nr:DNA double-strand break repair nuclease NurA [Desulfurococcales archaeon]